jgi:signal transduction histidine kinase
MRPNSLAFRLVVSAALWCALLLSFGGLGLAALFAATLDRTFDARLSVLLEGLVAGSELSADGRLDLRLQLGEPRFEQPLSGWYWQIDRMVPGSGESRPLARSPSLWDQTLELRLPPGQSMATGDIIGPEQRELRLVLRAISLPGSPRPLIYGVAGDQAELVLEQRNFDRLLALSLGALFLGLLVAIFLQVRFGLQPLRRMGRALAAIRTGRTRRLEGTFADEIQPLTVELNALLDHNEALVERARTHVGNLAHGLKTPLAVLTNEAARNEGALADLTQRQVEIMRAQVEHHLARARAAAGASVLGARCELAPVLSDLCRTLERIYAPRALVIDIDCPADLAFRGARQDLEEMLGNLLENACKWAATRVLARAVVEGERVVVRVEDDGPGLPAERRAEVLERGRRLDERVPGSGLGLAIVVDLAELYGGALSLERSELGGLCALLGLPAAPSA